MDATIRLETTGTCPGAMGMEVSAYARRPGGHPTVTTLTTERQTPMWCSKELNCLSELKGLPRTRIEAQEMPISANSQGPGGQFDMETLTTNGGETRTAKETHCLSDSGGLPRSSPEAKEMEISANAR